MKLYLKVTISFVTVILATSVIRANTGQDLHQRWHNKCFDCHGHSAEFSRKFLTISDGKLQGLHHTDNLLQFLQNHYLAGQEVDTTYNMLLAQTNTTARFMNECSKCHGTAVDLVRESITLHDGKLYSRTLESPIRYLLEDHRRLKKADIEFYMQLFTRIADEVYRPPTE